MPAAVSLAARTNRPPQTLKTFCCLMLCALAAGCGNITAASKNADGVKLYQQGQLNAAVESFQQAANTDPNNADANYNLGRVYHRFATLNDDAQAADRAEQCYQMAIARDGNHVEAHRALAVLYIEQGHRSKAFELLEAWAMRRTNSPDPRIELARLHEEFDNKDAAKEQLLEALSIDNENPRTLAALGRLRDEAGEYAQAMENYRKSLQYDQFQPEVASRITALQNAASSAPPYVPPGSGTRMVNSGNGTLR